MEEECPSYDRMQPCSVAPGCGVRGRGLGTFAGQSSAVASLEGGGAGRPVAEVVDVASSVAWRASGGGLVVVEGGSRIQLGVAGCCGVSGSCHHSTSS